MPEGEELNTGNLFVSNKKPLKTFHSVGFYFYFYIISTANIRFSHFLLTLMVKVDVHCKWNRLIITMLANYTNVHVANYLNQQSNNFNLLQDYLLINVVDYFF